jgi:transcription initiation factor IIE alpha subunit
MEYYHSQKLKDKWGKKHCEHPGFEKVYYTGAFLINYSCTVCGADFTIAQKMEILEERKKEGLSKK